MYYSSVFHSYTRMKSSWYNFRKSFMHAVAILLLFLLQQFILYYAICYCRNERMILYNLLWDGLLGLYILYGIVAGVPVNSVRCAIQWALYSITVVAKMIFFAFKRDANAETLMQKGLNHVAGDNLLSFCGLYITPVIYLFFNKVSRRALFSSDGANVSVDELLHSDLGLTTGVDLWDVVLMYNHLTKHYRSGTFFKLPDEWILTPYTMFAMIIICMTVIGLLGLTIPTVDRDKEVAAGSSSRGGSSPWTRFKRSIKIRPRRKKSCEPLMSFDKEDALQVDGFTEQKQFDNNVYAAGGGDDSYAGAGNNKVTSAPGTASNNTKVFSNVKNVDMFTVAKYAFLVGFFVIDVPFLLYRLYLVLYHNILCLMLYKNFLFLFLRPYRLNLFQLAERDRAKGWQTAFFELDSMQDPSYIASDILKVFEGPASDGEADLTRKTTERPINKRGIFSFAEAFRWQKSAFVRVSTLRPTTDATNLIAHASTALNDLDTSLSKSCSYVLPDPDDVDEDYENDLLKMLLRTCSLPTRGFGLAFAWRQLESCWCNSTSFSESWFDDFEIAFTRSEHWCFLTSLLVSVAGRYTLAVLSFGVASIRSPRFMLDRNVYSITLFELLNYSMLIIAPLVSLVLFLWLRLPILDVVFVAVKECINLLSYSICVCSMRDTISSRSTSTFYWLQATAFLLWPTIVAFYTLRHHKHTTCIMYLACKFGTCPCSVNYKFCTLQIFKSVQVVDDILHAQWSHLIYSTLFRILCCSVASSKALFGVVVADLVCGLCYIVYCQTLRVLMLRKHEVNFLLLQRRQELNEEQNLQDAESKGIDYCTLADVARYMKQHGLFSSPGILYPPFM